MGRFLRFALRYGVLGVILSVFYANTVISDASISSIYRDADAIPPSRVGVVLGTAPYLTDGTPNPYFTNRMDAASQLHRAGRIDYVLVSGDFQRSDYNEPAAMRQALMARGIPSRDIYLDSFGLNTFDSVLRAHRIYGLDEFTVISQEFHVERAVYIARAFDIEVVGFAARAVGGTVSLRTSLREYLARVKAIVDVVILQRNPNFDGAEQVIP